MDRRNFCRVTLGAGAALTLREPAFGQAAAPNVLWFNLQAIGGWDQALFCDPKPGLRGPFLPAATYPNAAEVVLTAGNIPYLRFADQAMGADGSFFQRFHDRMLVFNGVDISTNNHVVGERYSACGSLNDEMPCFSALVAGALASTKPLGFIAYSGGNGYFGTGGLVVPVKFNWAGFDSFLSLRQYNVQGGSSFMETDTLSKLEAAHAARLAAQRAAETLPAVVRSIEQQQTARAGQSLLANLAVPAAPNLAGKPNLRALPVRTIDLAFNAFAANLGVGATLSLCDFDTHSANESRHFEQLPIFLAHAAYIIEKADAAGVPCVVVLTSDFGRTPDREGGGGVGSGTGHWPIGSTIVLQSQAALGQLGLPADRVIGATDDQLRPRKVNPTTLLLSETGVILTPTHIHNALRRVAGISNTPTGLRFAVPLDSELAIG